MIKKFTARVLDTASIEGLKGNPLQRAKLAAAKNAQLYARIEDDFLKNGGVTPEQVTAILHELAPRVKVEIVEHTRLKSSGNISLKNSNGNIDGFKLSLPMIKPSEQMLIQDSSTLFHEVRHFFDLIINPKFTARHIQFSLFDILKKRSYSKFYESTLYTINKNKFHQLDRQQKKDFIKAKISKIFKYPKISSREKIAKLQEWRNNLKTEKNAYIDGITYGKKLALAKDMQSGVKSWDYVNGMSDSENLDLLRESSAIATLWQVRHATDNIYFFDGKIEVIEEMLKEEIVKARRCNAIRFRKTATAT